MEDKAKKDTFSFFIDRILNSTHGRDKTCRFLQHFFMFLHKVHDATNSDSVFFKITNNMWLTRKVLRLGLPLYLTKQIIDRFIYACYDDKASFEESRRRRISYQDSIVITEENKNEAVYEVNDVISQPKKKSFKELSIEEKLELILMGSSRGGAVGDHRRLVLTQTMADICLIMFCLFDIPLRKPSMAIKKAKYIAWLSQCIIVIIYQLVELKYVQNDIAFLKNYLRQNKVNESLESKIRQRISELKKNYQGRLNSLIRHSLDIPMVLCFIGVSFIPSWLASLIGSITSLMSLYSIIK